MNLCILRKFFRPLGLGLVPLEAEATYTSPRPLKIGLAVVCPSHPCTVSKLLTSVQRLIVPVHINVIVPSQSPQRNSDAQSPSMRLRTLRKPL